MDSSFDLSLVHHNFYHIRSFLSFSYFLQVSITAFSIKGGFRPKNTIRAGSRNLISYGLAFYGNGYMGGKSWAI